VTTPAPTHRGLHGTVLNALGSRIVSGKLTPGSTLDLEQTQSEFAVSRTVVREVLRELAAKGLIGARPGFGTFVQERSSWNLLDVDVMAWRNADGPDPRLLIELGQVRILVEPFAARLAAASATPAQLEQIAAAVDDMAASASVDDTTNADITFHMTILRASGNELLERFQVLLLPALGARDVMMLAHDQGGMSYLAQHRAVSDALAARDPQASEAAMRTLLELALEDTQAELRTLSAQE